MLFARQIVLGEPDGPYVEKIAIHTAPANWLRSGVNFRLFLVPGKFGKFGKFDPPPVTHAPTNTE